MEHDPGPAVGPLRGLLMPRLRVSSVMPGLLSAPPVPPVPPVSARVHPVTSSAATLATAMTPPKRVDLWKFVMELASLL